MKHISKLFVLLTCLIGSISIKAQDTTTTEKLIRYALQPLDKTQVPSNILFEFGAPILNLRTFNGILTDSNLVDINKLRTIMFQLNTGYTGISTSPFPDIESINTLIKSSVNDTLPIPIPIIIANYNLIDPEAITNNLISFNGGTKQFHDVPSRVSSPYLTHNLLASSPFHNERLDGSLQFIVKNDQIWNNSGKWTITK